MLVIKLKSLGHVRGIYGPHKDQFPTRAAFMHPEAADAFAAFNEETGPHAFSDILRGPDESLLAAKSGRGAQMPGYSGHNFGLSFDIDVERTMKEKNWSYEDVCRAAVNFGFYGYRQDLSRGAEEWHFNYLGLHAKDILPRTSDRGKWQYAAEEIIKVYYPRIVPLTTYEIQEGLKKVGMYSGSIDGQIGPLCKTSTSVFCQAWKLGTVDPNNEHFQRTLAFVTATKEIVG